METYKVKLTMGDWSKDGHEQSDCYNYLSNYPVEVCLPIGSIRQKKMNMNQSMGDGKIRMCSLGMGYINSFGI